MLEKIKNLFTRKEFRFQILDPNNQYSHGVPLPEPVRRIEEAYSLNTWVFKGIHTIAKNFASINYDVYRKKPGKNKDEYFLVENHPLKMVLDKPNPYMSGYDLREYLAVVYFLTGNAYILIERDSRGKPFELWPVPPMNIRPVSTKEKLISHYIYNVNGTDRAIPSEDVIHWRSVNPFSQIDGHSSLQAVMDSISADIFASRYNKNFFKNSARPDAVLQTDKTIDEASKKRMVKAWQQMHSGIRNAHQMAILDNGLKYNPIQSSLNDMQFIEQKKTSAVEILSALGVPPSVAGLLEYANYSNMQEQTKIFWMLTMLPTIRSFEELLNLRSPQIVYLENDFFQANTEHVEALRADMKAQSEITKNFVDTGIPLNAVIKALDLPFEPVEGGDESRPLRINVNQNPQEYKSGIKSFGKTKQSEERTIRWKGFIKQVEDREDVMKGKMRAFFRGQHKRVLGLLNANAERILAGRVSKDFGTLEINLIFDLDDEEKRTQRVVGSQLESVFFDFAKTNASKVKPQFNFNLNDPIAEDWLNNKKIKISREVNTYTRETLSKEVVEAIEDAVRSGYSQSETIAQIKDRIDEVYDFAVEGRAERIARTEVISASNAGSYYGMKAAGATKKEWLSTSDDRTRDTHLQADGLTVSIGESFSVGGDSLQFPGDPSGRPEEVINCRCTVLPVLEND